MKIRDYVMKASELGLTLSEMFCAVKRSKQRDPFWVVESDACITFLDSLCGVSDAAVAQQLEEAYTEGHMMSLQIADVIRGLCDEDCPIESYGDIVELFEDIKLVGIVCHELVRVVDRLEHERLGRMLSYSLDDDVDRVAGALGACSFSDFEGHQARRIAWAIDEAFPREDSLEIREAVLLAMGLSDELSSEVYQLLARKSWGDPLARELDRTEESLVADMEAILAERPA